jgi:hypothetical protein
MIKQLPALLLSRLVHSCRDAAPQKNWAETLRSVGGGGSEERHASCSPPGIAIDGFLISKLSRRLFLLRRLSPPCAMDPSCYIPANPDISGIGVRTAIYAQNILSFIPAFYALVDGVVDPKELQTIKDQSTTILVTAFAILISTIFQTWKYGLSDFHASVVLNLSWMNNTNTFIYFILYVHHRSRLSGKDKISSTWSAWARHVAAWLPRRCRAFLLRLLAQRGM